MEILEYISKHNIDEIDFAAQLEITPKIVHDIIYGFIDPSPVIALRIQLVTKKEVMATNWHTENLLPNLICTTCKGKGKVTHRISACYVKCFCGNCKGAGYIGHSDLFDVIWMDDENQLTEV